MFLLKFLQTKPQVKRKIKNYYYVYYTISKNLSSLLESSILLISDERREIGDLRRIVSSFLSYINRDPQRKLRIAADVPFVKLIKCETLKI